MVGIFSRLSGGRGSHRRTRSSLDARVWKERLTGNTLRQADLPIMKDEEAQVQPEKTGPRHSSPPTKPVFLPAVSAPERSIRKLLDECNTAED